jgi:hypothetical protein
MSANWRDPWFSVSDNQAQPFGLDPSSGILALPPMTGTIPNSVFNTPYRAVPQLFCDGRGVIPAVDPMKVNLLATIDPANSLTTNSNLTGVDIEGVWRQCWDDDLIMSGVRSFDIKAYDNSFPGYVDLGWGDDLRLYSSYSAAKNFINPIQGPNNFPLMLDKTPSPFTWPPLAVSGILPHGTAFQTHTQTYAHEGRIPPLYNDNRLDPNMAGFVTGNQNIFFRSIATYQQLSPALVNGAGFFRYDGNVGDDNVGVLRLRRVWDTWSTDYSNAPATGVDPATGIDPTTGAISLAQTAILLQSPIGPPFTPPVYPSYPPPYPMPLRAIQIQIRVVDPKNEQIKVLTIRQDFTDKL